MKFQDVAKSAVVALSLAGLIPPKGFAEDTAPKIQDKKPQDDTPKRDPRDLAEMKQFSQFLRDGDKRVSSASLLVYDKAKHPQSEERAYYEVMQLEKAGKLGEAKNLWKTYLIRSDFYGHHAVRKEIPSVEKNILLFTEGFAKVGLNDYGIIVGRDGTEIGYGRFASYLGGKISFEVIESTRPIRAKDDWIIVKKK